MAERENPWSTLSSRPHITLLWKVLPDGLRATWRGNTITIDPRLSRRERRAALMHELIHEERCIGWPYATGATMQREETSVRRETVRRLMPPEEVARFVTDRLTVGPVTASDLAEEFDVPECIAAQAELKHRRRAA